MRLLSSKPLSHFLSLSSSRYHRHHVLFGFAFSTASNSPAPYASSSSSLSQRRHDEESRAVRVSVWWDFENCSPPNGANVFKVAHCISSAVRASGIKGPVQITAFGDVLQLSRSNQEALSATGISLTHVPSGGKNSADRSLLVDLMYWVSHNPPPAHLFLISGDRDFAGILHKLRMSNYNILLACPDTAPSVLCSAASVVWHWSSLIKGENFNGRYFNQPPDGPYNSWYGHYKGVLEDPYAVIEPPARLQPGDLSDSETASQTKALLDKPSVRPVPNEVLQKLSNIVCSHPKGIPVSELQPLMLSGKTVIDKDMYGHKRFSHLLLSVKKIVRLKTGPKGQLLVFPTSRPTPVPAKCGTEGENQDGRATSEQEIEANSQDAVSVVSKSDGKNHDLAASSISKTENDRVAKTLNEKPSLLSSADIGESERKNDLHSEQKGTHAHVGEGIKPSTEYFPSRKSSGADEIEGHIAHPEILVEEGIKPSTEQKGTHAQVEEGIKPATEDFPSGRTLRADEIEGHIAHPETRGPETGNGFFQKLRTFWFGIDSLSSDKCTDRSADKLHASNNAPQPTTAVESPSSPGAQQFSDLKGTEDANDSERTADHDDKSRHSTGFFSKIFGWLSRKDINDHVTIEPTEESKPMDNSKKSELFLMDSFWKDVKSFLHTDEGTKLISNSTSREEIAQNLRKEGPLVIQPLAEEDLLHLIDLLVSEKKWILECPSGASFKLAEQTKGNDESAQTNNSTTLSTILSANANKPPATQGEKRESQTSTHPKGNDESAQTNNSTTLSTILSANANKPPATQGKKRESQTSAHPKVPFETENKPCWKTKEEVLSDCSKLLDELFKESPRGISIGHFKLKFLQEYGYVLDYRKLGYQKLLSLLQILPEVRVGQSSILPANTVAKETNPCEDESPVPAEVNDSQYEELGPVTSPALNLKELSCESSSSDDVLSDSEDEELPSFREENCSKKRSGNEDSSLLTILDSWYRDENIRTGAKSKTHTVSSRARPAKSYTFVSDSDDGGDPINGRFDGMKKSGEQRLPG